MIPAKLTTAWMRPLVMVAFSFLSMVPSPTQWSSSSTTMSASPWGMSSVSAQGFSVNLPCMVERTRRESLPHASMRVLSPLW